MPYFIFKNLRQPTAFPFVFLCAPSSTRRVCANSTRLRDARRVWRSARDSSSSSSLQHKSPPRMSLSRSLACSLAHTHARKANDAATATANFQSFASVRSQAKRTFFLLSVTSSIFISKYNPVFGIWCGCWWRVHYDAALRMCS